MDESTEAYLSGNSRLEMQALTRARAELARTGRPDLLARAELMHCAAHVASLDFEPCAGFDKLAVDAAEPERVYADYLAARPLSGSLDLLPPAQRLAQAAAAGAVPTLDQLGAVSDPLSRLIAIAMLFKSAHASPQMIDLAIDTASDLGWRRPLLAWLKVKRLRLMNSGDAKALERLDRRIKLVEFPSRS